MPPHPRRTFQQASLVALSWHRSECPYEARPMPPHGDDEAYIHHTRAAMNNYCALTHSCPPPSHRREASEASYGRRRHKDNASQVDSMANSGSVATMVVHKGKDVGVIPQWADPLDPTLQARHFYPEAGYPVADPGECDDQVCDRPHIVCGCVCAALCSMLCSWRISR